MRGTICADWVESDESTDEETVVIPGGMRIVKHTPGPGSYEHTFKDRELKNRTMTSPDEVKQLSFFMSSEERFYGNPMLEPKEGPGPGEYEIKPVF